MGCVTAVSTLPGVTLVIGAAYRSSSDMYHRVRALNFRDASYVILVGKKSQSGNA